MPFTKGKSGNSAGRPLGARGKVTLLKEERRRIFDEEVSQMWRDVIKKLRPEYIASQFIGRPVEYIKIEEKIVSPTMSFTTEAIKKIKEELKKRQLGSQPLDKDG